MADGDASLMRQFGVVLESMRSDVRILAERHAIVNAKLEREHDETVALASRTERVEVAVVVLAARTSKVETAITALAERTD